MTRLATATAPAFTLDDFQGNPVSLADFRGQENVVLVFNRDFMGPFCRRHMAQLRQNYQEFVKRDTKIGGGGPEDSKAFADYWTKEQLPFVGLSDPEAGRPRPYATHHEHTQHNRTKTHEHSNDLGR